MRPITPLLALLATACAPIALTPPVRTIPLESVATTREGHVALRASGGAHSSAWDAIATASSGVSVGVTDDAELQLDGAFGYSGDLDGQRSVSPYVGVGHIGLKHAVLPWLAFSGGAGLGVGPWGAFFGADLGIIAAYENPYAVPFLAARVQLTSPIDPSTEMAYVGGAVGVVRLTPTTTLWLQPSVGMRFPIRTDPTGEGLRLSLSVAAAWTSVVAFDGTQLSGGPGVESGIAVEF